MTAPAATRRGVRQALAALAAIALGTGALAGCGKRGNPLPPLRPLPGRIAEIQARRIGDRVELRFTIPARNADNTIPPVIEHLEIYAAVSEPATPPTPAKLQVPANLRGRIDVRKPPSDNGKTPPTAARAEAPKDTHPAPGEPVSYAGVMTADAGTGTISPTAVLNYLVVGVAANRRTPSTLVAVPLTPAPGAPHDPKLSYDEKTLTLAWTGDAATDTFRVYDVDAAGHETDGHPLNATPLTASPFTVAVEFDKARCFAVRAVHMAGTVAIESEATAPVCLTPADTFAPPAPALHTPVPSPGLVNLIWDAVDASDLAGYFVLRGEGADEKLQPLMTAPLPGTTYRDDTTRPGVRYVYAVVAVDKAGNRSAASNRVEAVGR